MHVRAITSTGGAVLGNRPLEFHSIEPGIFVDGNVTKRGFTATRPWKRGDSARFPAFSTWGYDILLAEKHFLENLGPRRTMRNSADVTHRFAPGAAADP